MNELARDWALVIIGISLVIGTRRLTQWFGKLFPSLRKQDAKLTQVLLDQMQKGEKALTETKGELSNTRLALRVSMAIHARNRQEAEGGLSFFSIGGQLQVDLVKGELAKLDIALPEADKDAVELVELIRDGKTERAAGRFPLDRGPRPPILPPTRPSL
ncbi:MAG: hypothetical protein F4X12_10285 [Acidobacteriia bacterium]|nr:hypothetical protein [Terriglobia bacterium]